MGNGKVLERGLSMRNMLVAERTLPPALRNPSGCLVLSHSLNTVYAVRFANLNCAFGTTSHTPIPLYEMAVKEV